MTQTGEVTFERKAIERMIEDFGQRVLMMGTLDQNGSLNIPADCYQDATQSFQPEIRLTGLLVDRIIEARKAKIAYLTEAVQNAPTDAEARKPWQELEHVLFGI